MIFLSDFLNAEVVDVRQHRVGRVRDLVVVMTDPFPRVTGVILKGNGKIRSIDWSVVRSWDNKELSLKVDEAALQPHTRADQEPRLALPHKTCHAIRIYCLRMIFSENRYPLFGVMR